MLKCVNKSAPRRAAERAAGLLAVLLTTALVGAVPAAAAPSTGGQDVVPAGATQAPSLIEPASGAVTTGDVSVSFSLPQTPQAGSVELVFSGSSTYTLGLSDASAGQASLTITPSNPSSSPGVATVVGGSTIAPGLYTITLSYQDAGGDPAATASAQSVAVSACPPGLYSATGFSPCALAQPGYYVALPGATSQSPCPSGSFANQYGSMTCLLTLAGTYAPQGTAAPIPCPAGSFCPAQAGAPTACKPGAYCPAQSGSPTPCSAGTFNPDASASAISSCQTVPAGSYAGAGAAAATTCPAGSACAQGASAPRPCDPGRYAPAPGAGSCTLADPGSFVAQSGAAAEQSCPAGTYSSAGGSAQCVAAPAGTYTPAGASAPIPCATGFTTTAPGESSCTALQARLRIVGVTVLARGRVRLRLQTSGSGTLSAVARAGRYRYGSAKRTAHALVTSLLIRRDRHARRRVTRITIIVTFRPSTGARPVRRKVTVALVHRRGRR